MQTSQSSACAAGRMLGLASTQYRRRRSLHPAMRRDQPASSTTAKPNPACSALIILPQIAMLQSLRHAVFVFYTEACSTGKRSTCLIRLLPVELRNAITGAFITQTPLLSRCNPVTVSAKRTPPAATSLRAASYRLYSRRKHQPSSRQHSTSLALSGEPLRLRQYAQMSTPQSSDR